MTEHMNDEQTVELLEGMVSIPSVSTEEEALAEYLVTRMNRLGFDAHIDEAGNAVGIIGDGPVEGVLLGHIDTVPGRVPVRIEDGKLYGRGAVDAKGPFASFIAATTRLYDRIPDLPMRLAVVGCVEEEVPSSKGARFARDQYRPHFAVIGEPSGWAGITLGYKGYMRANLRTHQPCSHTAHQQATIAEHGCTTWNALHAATERFNEGRERAFDQLFTRLVGMTTGSDGRYDWAELALNIRLPLDFGPEQAEPWLREQIKGSEVDVQGQMQAWSGPRTTPLHRAFATAIRQEDGNPTYLRKTGTADLNIVAPEWNCPALAYGPGDAALDHTPNEHIEIDEYLAGVRVLERALERLATRSAPELTASGAGGASA